MLIFFPENGVIDFDEFTRLISLKGLKSQEEEKEELRLAFKIFDRDNSNFIDSAELAEVMKRLGEEGLTSKEIDEMIKVADKNKDGKINYNGLFLYIFFTKSYKNYQW